MTKRQKIASNLELIADDIEELAEAFREKDHDLWYALNELHDFRRRLDQVSAEISAISSDALDQVVVFHKRVQEAQ